jgi:TonB family protein
LFQPAFACFHIAMFNLLRRCALVAAVCTAASPLAAQDPAPAAPRQAGGVASSGPVDAPGPDSTGAYELIETDDWPRILNRAALITAMERSYPGDLRRAGVEALVQVRFRMGANGRVTHASVTSSTDPRFNEVSIAAVQALRTTPARVDRQAVPVWLELPLQWTP